MKMPCSDVHVPLLMPSIFWKIGSTSVNLKYLKEYTCNLGYLYYNLIYLMQNLS